MNLASIPTPALADELTSRPDGMAALPTDLLRAEAARRLHSPGRTPLKTECPRCHEICPSARMARKHCRKPRKAKEI